MASQTLDSQFPQTKRLKTLTPSPPQFSKSKEKFEETLGETEEKPMDSDLKNCGICLSEESKSIRGLIDSCDHYFCFVCIMEWSKVESKCPMCKRRFSAIRRAAKDGVFQRERIVDVPIRDQVYHYLGNATTGPHDPYAEAHCSVCNGTSDDSYLLLCDLCDSASHTYCVGLGFTIPDGDWFCEDCSLSRAGHANSETDTYYAHQTSLPKNETHDISIFDVVHPNIPGVERPVVAAPVADDVAGARTLHRCRNVLSRIQALRENWNAVRSGSLRFFSDSGKSSQENETPENDLSNRGPYNVDKAWKMMEIAKSSSQRAQEKSNGKRKSHKSEYEKSSKIAKKGTLKFNECPSVSNGAKLSHKRSHETSSHVGADELHSSRKFQTAARVDLCLGNNGKLSHKDSHETSSHVPVSSGPGADKLHSSRKFQTPPRVDLCFGNGGKLSHKHSHETSSNVPVNFSVESGPGDDESHSSRKFQKSPCVDLCFGTGGKLSHKHSNETSSDVPVRFSDESWIGADKRCVKPEVGACVDEEGVSEARKRRVEKSCVGSKMGKNDDAKSEVQSLVKLNLKLLRADKRLDVEAFKEVARLATHTILSTCGLESPKPGARSFPNSVCHHINQNHQVHISTLMPNSCRECFYVFVKRIVNSTFEKKGRAKFSH